MNDGTFDIVFLNEIDQHQFFIILNILYVSANVESFRQVGYLPQGMHRA